jgi:hypothetical protein
VFLVADRPEAGSVRSAWPPPVDEPASGERPAETEGVYRDEPAPEPGDPTEDPFCSFWKGNDARVCVELCTVLDEVGIPHKTVHRQDHLFNFNNQPAYELGVPASFYEKAELAVKEAFGNDEDEVRLLPPPEEDPRTRTVRKVWAGKSATECASLCSELKTAGIYYRVDERRWQSLGKRLEERYEVVVAEKDFQRAQEITGGIEYVESADEGDGEDGAEDPDIALEALDSEPREPLQRIRDEDWHPEDATELVWSGEPEWQEAIEMALRENDVRTHWETQDGKRNLYVLPQHEKRAREIVREVVEGAPMQ